MKSHADDHREVLTSLTSTSENNQYNCIEINWPYNNAQ